MRTNRIALPRRPLVPTRKEAKQSAEILEALRSKPKRELALSIKNRSGSSKTVSLPDRAAHLLLAALSQLAEGRGLRMVPIRRELTTHEAAEILNVSRTHLIGLLEKGEIPHRMVGSHRRIDLTDLLAYQAKTDGRRKQALQAMADEAQELKLYE